MAQKNNQQVLISQGDMFNDSHDILVNPVNCVGVMGGGLALAFKQKWPVMFREYKKACNRLRPGQLHIWNENISAITAGAPDITIINFPTKDHYRDPSKLEYIESGIQALNKYIESLTEEHSIGIPALGCGLGGLNWNDVRPLMLNISRTQSITIYEPK